MSKATGRRLSTFLTRMNSVSLCGISFFLRYLSDSSSSHVENLKKQSKSDAKWIRGAGFAAKDGELLLVPGSGGAIGFAVLGLGAQNDPLAQSLGPKAHVGTPRAAAAFGDVVLISVPYAATPQIGRDLAHELAGKVVIDTGNPYPNRDGDMAVEARRKGTGVASAEFLPGVRLVRAFNAISAKDLASEAHRSGAGS